MCVLALLPGCGELARWSKKPDPVVEKWEGVHTVEVLQQAPALEAGRVVFVRRACVTCHSIDGSRNTGPSLLGVAGSTVTLSDGSTIPADADYLRHSILRPTDQIVAGFRPEMPSYANIRPAELNVLVAYIQSLEPPPADPAQKPDYDGP